MRTNRTPNAHPEITTARPLEDVSAPHDQMLVWDLADNLIAIEDLRSSNGIFVNTRKVNRCDLRPGDTVTIGNVWLRISQG